MGDRRQDGGQEMGDRTEVHKNVDFVIKMGDRRKETEDRRQETEERRQETKDRRQETRDIK